MAVVGLAAGCAILPGPIEPPRLSIASLDVAGGGLFEQDYRITVRIQNPNPFALPVEGMEYALDINGRRFASGVSNRAVTVPRLGSALAEVRAVSTLFSLLRQLDEFRQPGLPGLNYRLSGRIYLADGSRMPFDYRGEVGSTP
jgi:LEA14-like dessication related protein